MQVIYALEEFPKTFKKAIFLAGPTTRLKWLVSWRPEALHLLETSGYDGVVFVPEPRPGTVRWWGWDDQVAWEVRGLNLADVIVFWVPRNLVNLPGLTTNVEYGEWFKSGKIVLGAPKSADKVRYLKKRGVEYFVPQADTLVQTIDEALAIIGDGALRQGGECQVPLHIWRTPSFQSWYQAQLKVGNRLDGARVEYVLRVGPKLNFLFLWILRVNIYVASERRNKTNESVISRSDISSVLLYKKGKDIYDTTVVLVKEFRSPVSNSDGFVHELPGGSSFKPDKDPLMVAASEVFEETSLKLDPGRVVPLDGRQLAATLSAHKALLFSVALTDKELAYLRSQSGIAQGNDGDSERTYVEVATVADILRNDLADWSTLGMIFSGLSKVFMK
jgi:8-oxo-dGTP pyrophosphatase MutT (NUDIX family)